MRMWARPGALVCDFAQPAGRVTDPFLGCRPPELDASPGDGMWLARQLCDRVDIRSEMPA